LLFGASVLAESYMEIKPFVLGKPRWIENNVCHLLNGKHCCNLLIGLE
jgi:hypothetical protein